MDMNKPLKQLRDSSQPLQLVLQVSHLGAQVKYTAVERP